MDIKDCHSYRGLRKIPELLDFEMLISRPGSGEPDANFIWAPTFMAPESMVMLDGQMFLNLFLPEGSENDPEKKLFLNRVGAKLQDGLWQVRRRMDQLKGKYGGPMQFALSNFKTTVVDQAYIKNGRNYGHMLLHSSELDMISKILLMVQKERPDIRVEYFRKMERGTKAYLIPEMDADLGFVTMEFGPGEGKGQFSSDDGETFFMLANYVEGGVKAISMSKTGNPPEILKPAEVSKPAENMCSFRSNNPFILSLVRTMANQYAVVYGFYGTVTRQRATLTVAMPTQQVQAFMRTLAEVAGTQEECFPLVTEVLSMGDFTE